MKRDFIISISAILFLILLTPIFTYAYYANALTSQDRIMNKNDTGILLLDRNGKPFFSFYSAKQRKEIALSDVPKYTQEAVISSEDKDFYHHPGFSIQSIVRATYDDLTNKDALYGGSTITQQLVKNALLTPQKSLTRKFQEIILANEIERRYNKSQILQMYLNSVYFGDGSFGIEEASERDFNKSAKDLTLGESALLAGILSAPSQLSPISGDKAGALKRQKIVLSEMKDQGYITQKQEDEALSQNIQIAQNSAPINAIAPHFALMVRDQLVEKYGEEEVARSGFKVKTTINVSWQQVAQDEVAKQVANLKADDVSNGAAVVEDPKTGEILALVGSKDWNDPNFGKFNVADAARQPGSSFKPIVYVAAMQEHLITPATLLKDEPITYNLNPGTYSPHDYDNRFRGLVTVRRALSNSLNVPAVQVLSMLGIPQAVDMAKRLGITTLGDPSQYGLSLVLGAAEVKPIELTNVYATFANNGVENDPTLITQITDKNGDIIYNYTPKEEQVIDPQYTFLISSILSDNITRAEEFGNLLNIDRVAAVKTGTTSDFKDSWTLGYTPSLAVGVWVGNNDNTPMDNVAGSLGAAPIWRHLMEDFLAGTPSEAFKIPDGIIAETICRGNGLLSKGATSSAMAEYFAEGTQPTGYCNSGSIAQITPFVSTGAPSLPSQAITPGPATLLPTQTPTEHVTQIEVNILPNGKIKEH